MTKTLEMWKAFDQTGEKDISAYLHIGDIMSADLIDYIKNHTLLKTNRASYIQISEPEYYFYDIARILRPVYPTFAEYDIWRFYGFCYQFETINRY